MSILGVINMKKQLLNESEIRKMMKFANIGPLAGSFVGRLNEAEETEEEDPGADFAGAEEDPEDFEDPTAAEEPPTDVEAGAEDEGTGSQVLDAVGELVEKLKDVLELLPPDGPEVAAMIQVQGADAEDTADAGMEDFAAADLGGEAEFPPVPGEEEEAPTMVAEVEMVDEEEVEEEVVNEVARRVARRLKILGERKNML
jgi:hypothetical protein